jgi:hypothetical protein
MKQIPVRVKETGVKPTCWTQTRAFRVTGERLPLRCCFGRASYRHTQHTFRYSTSGEFVPRWLDDDRSTVLDCFVVQHSGPKLVSEPE